MCLFGPSPFFPTFKYHDSYLGHQRTKGYMPCMNIVARPMEYDTQGMQSESREVDGRWPYIRPSHRVFCSFTIELNIYERRTILFVCWRFDILDYGDVFYHIHAHGTFGFFLPVEVNRGIKTFVQMYYNSMSSE
jgi:hypothetical protein